VVVLERRLPHKMLVATGLLSWLPVSPVDGLELPYWAGLWLGLFPTWEGLLAQAGAAAFVVGRATSSPSGCARDAARGSCRRPRSGCPHSPGSSCMSVR
jgi:high-affinity iron transporter